MERLTEIKKEIRTINPEISDGLLDLLYEYIIQRLAESINNLPSMKKD